MDFDVDAARKAGYSDQEIADHLSQVAGFDASKARDAGYSDQEIIDHLSQAHIAKVAAPVTSTGPTFTPEAPSVLANLGAGLNDVYQGVQYVGNKLGSLIPGQIGQDYQTLEANRVAQQQEREQEFEAARQAAGVSGFNLNRAVGAGFATLPFGGLVGTGIRALGAGAEAAGLGSAGGNTGLAGFLNTLGANTTAGGAGLNLGARVAANAAEGTAQGGILGGGQGNAQEGAVAGGVGGAVLPVVAAPIQYLAGKAAKASDAFPALKEWFQKAYNAAQGSTPSGSSDIPGVSGDALNASLADHGLNPSDLSGRTKINMAQEAQKQADTLGQADPDALARSALLDELGLTKTNGMVSRNPIEWAQEREVAKDPKFGTPLMNAYTNNMKKIVSGLGDLGDATGGTVATPYQAGNNIGQAIQGRYDELGKGISDLYQGIRDTQGGNLASDAKGLYAQADELADEKAGAPIVDSVMRRLKRYGMVDSQGDLTNNTMDVNQAEELRKFIGAQVDQNDPAQRRIGNLLTQAHDQDVAQGAGGQTFEAGRNAFQQRMTEFNNTPQKAILTDKISPEDVINRYFINGKVDDLRALNMTLQNSAEGQQAWNDGRRQVADWIENQATAGKGSDGLTFDRLNRAINTIGPEKMQMLFGDDAAKYQQWLKATQITSAPPGEAPVNRSNTASALLNAVKMAGAIPGLSHIPGSGMIVDKAVSAVEGIPKTAKVNRALEGTAVTPADVKASQALRRQAAPTVPGLPMPSTLAGLLGLSAARPNESASP